MKQQIFSIDFHFPIISYWLTLSWHTMRRHSGIYKKEQIVAKQKKYEAFFSVVIPCVCFLRDVYFFHNNNINKTVCLLETLVTGWFRLLCLVVLFSIWRSSQCFLDFFFPWGALFLLISRDHNWVENEGYKKLELTSFFCYYHIEICWIKSSPFEKK